MSGTSLLPSIRAAALRGCAAGVIALISVSALRAQPIDTKDFRYVPPPGWTADLLVRPVTITGPAKEVLRMSSKSVAGPRTPEAAAALKEIEATAVRSIQSLIRDEKMKLVRAPARRQLANGAGITELEGRSADGLRSFTGFVVTGPRSVLLVTLAASGNAAMAVTAARKSLEAIQWK